MKDGKFYFSGADGINLNPSKGEQWNRGAYLAEAVADCSGCHTPRNTLGGQTTRSAYAGALIDGWIAPALNAANHSPVPWTEEELFTYLRTGASPLHGATAATMTDVIRESLALSVVPDSDVRAIAVYFRDMNRALEPVAAIDAKTHEALETSDLDRRQGQDPDAGLYVSACISCHYNSGDTPLPARPELALNSALTSSDPTNFIQTVLKGVGTTEGAPGLVMPEYASSLSDGEIVRLAAYPRPTRTKSPPWTDSGKQGSEDSSRVCFEDDAHRSDSNMTTFDLNGRTVSVHSTDDTPLLWTIRDEFGLTRTKFGCGIGFCGACTVHVEGRATRSCVTPTGAVAGAKVTTIEGLDSESKHAV